MVSRKPQWSELPHELLTTISDLLKSDRIAVNTFRSVCSSWRSSCNRLTQDSLLSPLLPLPLPRLGPPLPFLPSRGFCPVSLLSVTVIYALRCPSVSSDFTSNTWVLFLDEFTSGKVRVREPFVCGSYSVPINFPDCVDLVDCNAVELGRFYSLSYPHDKEYQGCFPSKTRFHSGDVGKVVLSRDGLAVIVLFDDGILGMIRLGQGGGSIGKWEIIHDGRGFRFDDIVEFKGRVLGIDRRGRVYEISYHSSEINPFVPPIAGGGGRRKRLVESLGLLYLVVRCDDKRNKAKVRELNEERKKAKLKVYELNEKRTKWVEINSIGNRSFFFGIDFSYSASAQELGTSEMNCVLFKKGSFPCYRRGLDEDMVFRNLRKSDLYVGVCHLGDAAHFRAIESYSGFVESLWPPPSWVWSIDRPKRLEILETTLDEILNMIPEKFKTTDKEQPMEAVLDSFCNFLQRSVREITKEVLELRKDMISFQASLKQLKEMDQRLQEVMLTHGRRDCRDLNQMMRDLLRVHYTSLFLYEERTSLTERHAKARLPATLFDSSRIAEN